MFDRILNTPLYLFNCAVVIYYVVIIQIFKKLLKYLYRFFKSKEFHECGRCPYSEFFWSVFSLIHTEYGDLLGKCLHWVRIQENTDQKNPKYGLFSRSVHEYKKHKKTEFYVVHIFLLSVCKWEYRDQRNLVFYVFSTVFFPETIQR